MKFERYDNMDAFIADTLELMLENEVQNNLPIGFTGNKDADCREWLLSSIKDDSDAVVLIAACTPPFNIVLYETGNRPCGTAVRLLSDELKSIGMTVPGVLAEQDLAIRFATEYTGDIQKKPHLSMNIMRLDSVNSIKKSSGKLRLLRDDDLFFAPYWERAFGEECRVEVYDIQTNVVRLKKRITDGIHFIWEDSIPVSQAVHGRSTVNGAVINGVYTPPQYRCRGYASSAVSELSQLLLDNGYKFCCLFADANNPVSCGIYRKIGFYDLCVFNEIKF